MKYFTVLILMLTSLNSYSQEHVQYFKKNNLKVNISSIVLKTYSTSFERMISNRVSVQIGYSKNLYNNFFKTSIGEKLVSIAGLEEEDRKSTRLNSSHSQISYAVFCLKKKKKK